MRARTILLAMSLLGGTSVSASATDYYISAAGSDSNAGTAATPVVVTSYGSGRATIASGPDAGISAYNTSGISIANVNLAGAGGPASGISFYTDLPGDVTLPFVRIDAVDVIGYGRDGIEIGAWNGRSGFADVRVTNAAVHGNARTGLFTYAQLPNVHRQIYVGRVTAYDNPGLPGASSNSGSGIVVAGVDGATIERSVARGNGWLCTSVGGPVGIWTYDSTRVTIRHNESFGNSTGASWDGGGFDLDQNVSDAVVQYNYSHDNDGAGFLLAHSLASGTHRGNVIRYNISKNDGRANSYAGIEVWGGVNSAEIYNNTVIASPAASGTARAVRVWNDGATGLYPASVHFRSNTLLVAGVAAIDVTPAVLAGASDLTFAGNYISGAAGNPDPATTGVNEVLLTAASATMSGGWITVADVISPSKYLSAAPGTVTGDTTIVR